MRRNNLRRSVAGLLVLATVAAACGSDDEDAASTSATAAPTTAASATTTGSTGGTATTAGGPATTGKPKPASGEPIKIGFIGTESPAGGVNIPQGREAAKAAVDYINEELGGVRGRPLQLENCAVLGTPESSVSCSNQLVDKKVIVVNEHNDSGNNAGIPIVKAAGIPYYTPYGAGSGETTTDGVFNFSGSLTNYVSLAKFASTQKWPKVGILAIGVAPVIDGYAKYGKASFEKYGVQANFVTFEPTAADLTAQFKTASEGAKAVLIVGAANHCVAGITASKALGNPVPLMVHSVCWNKSVLDAMPNGGKGAYLIGDDTSPLADDPDTKVFVEQMKKRSPSTNADGLAAVGFLSMVNLQRVLNQIPAGSDITPATAMAAFRATKDMPLFMMRGAKATCDGKQITGLVSICHGGYWIGQYDGSTVKVMEDVDGDKLLSEILKG